MADNLPLTTDASKSTATRELGATGPHVALVELVRTSGALGSRVIGGLNHHVVAAGTTNAAVIKASAGKIYSIKGFNDAAYPVFLKFHNTASAPTPGAGVVLTIGIQAGTALPPTQWDGGFEFSAGISRTIVKGIADSNAVAVAADDCVFDVEYV